LRTRDFLILSLVVLVVRKSALAGCISVFLVYGNDFDVLWRLFGTVLLTFHGVFVLVGAVDTDLNICFV
jgi:hypothetical protein